MRTEDYQHAVAVTATARLPGQRTVDAAAACLYVTPRGSDAIDALPGGATLRRRAETLRGPGRAKAPDLVAVDLPNAQATHAVWLTPDPAHSPFQRLGEARRAVAEALGRGASELLVVVAGFEAATAGPSAEVAAEAIVAAALATAARLPDFRREARPKTTLARLVVHGVRPKDDFARVIAEAEGNALARHLTDLPPNVLTPGEYRRRVEVLARRHGWSIEVLGERQLARRGAGAFLAVSRASPERDACVVHLRRAPRGSSALPGVALVGKGICFDTGGVNVKTARYMRGMHGDMAGSAVALGTLLALTRLDVPFAVDAWLALAENHIGPNGYKPNDVVTALDGTRIEVVHTDAEGRMVLADTLALAAEGAPALIIDYATLTGSCIQALGKAYSGAFSNRPEWVDTLIAAGRDSGERIWPFPLDEDYDQALESGVADTLQCAPDGEADHIIAARFLGRFVGKRPWVHVDLSSASHRGGLAHIPTETTGFGVRLTLRLLIDVGLQGRGASAPVQSARRAKAGRGGARRG